MIDAKVKATKVSFSGDTLNVVLSNGKTLIVPTVLYPRLQFGSATERRNFRLIGEGCGIHWEDLEEDISIANLIAGQGSAEAPRSILTWLLNRAARKSASGNRTPRIKIVNVPAKARRQAKRVHLKA